MPSPPSTEGPNLETSFVIGPESRIGIGRSCRQVAWRDLLIIASSSRTDGYARQDPTNSSVVDVAGFRCSFDFLHHRHQLRSVHINEIRSAGTLDRLQPTPVIEQRHVL